jgi:hypothetical protein
LGVSALRYGRDDHYDVVSAFIKSIRGSDPQAGLFWLARMLESGDDAKFIARRLVILASEDIGMADPNALVVAVAPVSTLFGGRGTGRVHDMSFLRREPSPYTRTGDHESREPPRVSSSGLIVILSGAKLILHVVRRTFSP